MLRAGVLSAVLALNAACAAAPPAVPDTPPLPGAARDEADMVAQEAVNARVTMLLHLDRLRGFRFSRRLMLLGGWAEALEGTEIDPLEDVTRAFIAAHASHEGQVAVVLQHTAPEDRVVRSIRALYAAWQKQRRAARVLPARGDGAASDDTQAQLCELEERAGALGGDPLSQLEARLPDPARLPFPAAFRLMKTDFAHTREPVLIAAPHPGLLAILPPERIYAVFRMMEVAGLPRPRGDEAMVFRAWDPVSSIQNGPAWSPDVRYADVMFSFDGAGNSTLTFRALCTSPESAREQARRMTSQVEEAQTISLGGTRLRLFDYIQFHAEHDRVRMRTRLFAEDLDWIVAMTMKPL